MNIQEILNEISISKNCRILPLVNWQKKIDIPEDLEFYFNYCGGIEFFIDKPYSINIVGGNNFEISNTFLYPEGDVIWEELEGDISNDWFIIGKSNPMSQYISIDMNSKRLGYCYDSFIETHANPNYSPTIAKNFTELLEKLFLSKGERWYWLENNFKSYGDAYKI